ncbi:MAG TPA: alanine racemase [Tissierellales bacterium]|nr:alanine racemase [Tissierellales bacterium]
MDKFEGIRPVWAEINIDNLAYNMREIRYNTDDNALVIAVVKADAYGHGSIEAARVFLKNGADRLAVATVEEGIELRKAGIEVPILILGATPNSQHELTIKWNLIETVFNYKSAKNLSEIARKNNKIASVHIKIDTGMGRIGFLSKEEIIKEIEMINDLSNLRVEGIFTHFAKADEKDKSFTRKQFERFNKVINEIEKLGINIPIKHVSNSAGIIDLPEYNLDMVRPGIINYGLYPSNEVNKERIKLKPAMTLKARISNIKKISKNTGISYGHTFITKRESVIGTIPIGYADGFTRILSHKAEVIVKGKRVPVIGTICMDQCMIDLTGVNNVNIGDEVIIFGGENNSYMPIEEVAKKIGTINYEIVCMVGRRIPRIYKRNGKTVKVVDYLID